VKFYEKQYELLENKTSLVDVMYQKSVCTSKAAGVNGEYVNESRL
jgi:hypothetical protein